MVCQVSKMSENVDLEKFPKFKVDGYRTRIKCTDFNSLKLWTTKPFKE
jgi:hypothetical protein